MKILMSTECLRVGGAQIFALRLSKALSDQGHEVLNYIFFKDYVDKSVVIKNHPNINLVYPDIYLDLLLRKVDRLLYKLRIDFSFRDIFVKSHQRKIVEKFCPEVVHSHMFQSDYKWSSVMRNFHSIKFVITMHGSYETFMKYDLEKLDGRVLNFQRKLKNHLFRVNEIAYLTKKNLDIFDNGYVSEKLYPNLNTTQIYNGFEEPENFQPLKKYDINIEDESIVFGMVARGIEEKGWEIAIDSFCQLDLTNSYLLLIGHSEYVDGLKEKYSGISNIFFMGRKENPLDWINIFDVGILPSFYGESLPNSIVEYMYCGKPVIATDIGECKHMLKTDEGEFGIILPNLDRKSIIEDLSNAMKDYADKDKSDYKKESLLAKKGFNRFAMRKCIDSYLHLYQ